VVETDDTGLEARVRAREHVRVHKGGPVLALPGRKETPGGEVPTYGEQDAGEVGLQGAKGLAFGLVYSMRARGCVHVHEMCVWAKAQGAGRVVQKVEPCPTAVHAGVHEPSASWCSKCQDGRTARRKSGCAHVVEGSGTCNRHRDSLKFHH
jgi:hypothetical protein